MRRLGRASTRSAASIVATSLLTVTLAGCAQEFQHDHHNVVNAESFLRQADSHFLTEMKRKPVNLGDRARCYFAVAASDGQIQRNVYCGAARAYGGRAGQVWWKLTFTPKERGAEVRLTRPTLAADRATRRPDDVELIRPSGAGPSRKADRIPAPAAHPGEAGAMVADGRGANFQAARRPREKGVLVGPTFQVKVSHAGRAAAVSRPDGGMAAAPGETLFAADLTLGDGITPPDDQHADAERGRETTYTLVSGTRKRDVTKELSGRKRAVLAVSAPKSADPRLEVTVDGMTQALSLKTGARVGAKAAAYYRPDPATSIDEEYRERASRGDFRFVHSERYDQATLTPYSAEFGWAPAGRAWLMITYQDAELRDKRSQRFTSARKSPGAYTLKVTAPKPRPSGAASASPVSSANAQPSAQPNASPSGQPNGSPSATASADAAEAARVAPPRFRGLLGADEGVIVFEVPDNFTKGEFRASPAFSFTSPKASPASGAVTLPTRRYALKVAA